MEVAVLVDFGSTFTKLVAVDRESGALAATAQARTTAQTDMMEGLEAALEQLDPAILDGRRLLRACSSAAGGLAMVAVGLVPHLTVEAASRAALGAGAKVVGTFGYKLSPSEVRAIAGLGPDMILLAGGTDGGDEAVLLHNSRMLAALPHTVPVIVAGNKVVAEEATAVLAGSGKPVRLTGNVMPALGRLDVEPVQEAIRDLFMSRIVEGKGLARVASLVDGPIVPTPMAVLAAARLLAHGGGGESGLGELMAIDVGGATTDVHSVASGAPAGAGVVQRGLPQPHAMRTVEGDLGIRWNAPAVVERMPAAGGDEAMRRARHLAAAVHVLPDDEGSAVFDAELARAAVAVAVGRHVGRLETVYSPQGPVAVQYGKDLTNLPVLIGTGGVFRYGVQADRILSGGLFDPGEPAVLRPRGPRCYVDAGYVLAAAGLLGESDPGAAVRLMRASLRPVGPA